ncbi:MAG: ATP-binding protein [Bacteroidota bacterium]|nr:ATP-binding protein [Bacteroidota bacterium]
MKTISLHIMDIVQNSIRAKAQTVEIYIMASEKKNILDIIVKDDGKGMNAEMLEQITDPFTTSRKDRKVGLGISLLKQNAEKTGGSFSISSAPEKGTMLNATFTLNNLDTPPIGDIVDTMVALTSGNPNNDFIYSHITDAGEYTFKTKKVKKILGDIAIYDTQVTKFLREMIKENILENCKIKVD